MYDWPRGVAIIVCRESFVLISLERKVPSCLVHPTLLSSLNCDHEYHKTWTTMKIGHVVVALTGAACAFGSEAQFIPTTGNAYQKLDAQYGIFPMSQVFPPVGSQIPGLGFVHPDNGEGATGIHGPPGSGLPSPHVHAQPMWHTQVVRHVMQVPVPVPIPVQSTLCAQNTPCVGVNPCPCAEGSKPATHAPTAPPAQTNAPTAPPAQTNAPTAPPAQTNAPTASPGGPTTQLLNEEVTTNRPTITEIETTTKPATVETTTPLVTSNLTSTTSQGGESDVVAHQEQQEIQNALQNERNTTGQKTEAEKDERDALVTLREKHGEMLAKLSELQAEMKMTLTSEDHNDINMTLGKIQNNLANLEATEKEQRYLDKITMEKSATAATMRKKEQAMKLLYREKQIALRETLTAAAMTFKRRCVKWTGRVDKAESLLAVAFKQAMLSSTVAEKGAKSVQNDLVTKAQLKWSLSAINEVKCTLKFLLASRVNKLKVCKLSGTAQLALLKMDNTLMPPYDVPGLHSDQVMSGLSLTRARAEVKTKTAKDTANALKAEVEKKGVKPVRTPPELVDTETGKPEKGSKETTDMLFERIMGRPLDLSWQKPAFNASANAYDAAVTECLGGNCNLTKIDEKNDFESKKLANGPSGPKPMVPVPKRL